MTDVEVQRVAVQQQEKRRNEDQDQQGAPVTRNLAQLFPADRECLAHAAAPRARSAFSTTSRKTSSSDGGTSAALTTSMPSARSRSATTPGATPAWRKTACTAVPKRLVFSTSAMPSSTRIASTG